MPQGNPKAGEKYLHFKNKLYQIITIARHSETNEEMVVYQALYGTFKSYVRPLSMFISEVDRSKYPSAAQKYRFQYLEDESLAEQIKTETEFNSLNGNPDGNLNEELNGNPGENPTGDSGENPKEAADDAGLISEWLIRFLDAESFDKKYEIVTEMKDEINDKLIDDIAVSLDIVIPEGNLQSRYQQLKNCIRTRQKFEGCRI